MKTSHGKSLAIVLLAVSCFYITACTDDNNSPPEEETIDLSCQERPDEPESFELDLNDDGVSDYEISYGLSDIESATASAIIAGRLIPLGSNELLKINSSATLFLRDIAAIQNSVDTPLSWSDSSKFLVFIELLNEGVWTKNWRPYSQDEHLSYFVGLKILNDNLNLIGWIELDINNSDGTIEIIDKGII